MTNSKEFYELLFNVSVKGVNYAQKIGRILSIPKITSESGNAISAILAVPENI